MPVMYSNGKGCCLFFFSCRGTINQQYIGLQKRIKIWSYVYRNWQKRISPFLDSPFRRYSIQRGDISGNYWQSHFGPRALEKLNRNPHPNNGNFEGSKKVRALLEYNLSKNVSNWPVFCEKGKLKRLNTYSLNDTIGIQKFYWWLGYIHPLIWIFKWF